ncbi:ATP-dependent DNA helicase RecG [Hydrogenophaga sp. PAMC20947]|uniref:ATP-dependent DNA helicase RecG n=1 Tax=Hydrogenophaga sp. PAMC20947 TaxID=2565558 RepID=UPI00109DE63F|nr:ATP-dependent DNA helicase RecG [Hydrogenophaga sp. PAMC20947]QCB47131.1 ATP-dependent DNA helicase RecG [Hydrogenophaga sp. PAMC20947]
MPAPIDSKSAAPALSAPQKALRKLGLVRDIDLALHLPLRYEDETRIVKLSDAREGQTVQVEGTVVDSEVSFRPRRQLLVTLDDGSDTCTLRFFSFYPSHQNALAVGARVRVRGEVRGGFMGRTMMHPSFHAAGGELPDALTPVYPTSAQLPQAYLRKAVASGLRRADLSETVPPALLHSLADVVRNADGPLFTLRDALAYLHHPGPEVSLDALEDRSHPAWQRLKAEELLAQQLSQLVAKRERDALRAPALRAKPGGLHEQLLAVLPFSLTAAQRRVGDEIASDLARQVPMHRLLQGDVGSGKTVVAALAATIAMDAGWQCALMAPTEILAEQHFSKLIGWLEPLLSPLGKRVAWLTGGQKKKQRTEMLALIASGEAALVVGTHAVIQDQVQFRNLALAIIDEQHRFGVAQRLALRSKMGPGVALTEQSPERRGSGSASSPALPLEGRSGDAKRATDGGETNSGRGSGSASSPALPLEGRADLEPHLLMMTATPIPRTLAMSYYADLDVSTIDELPPGRTPILTKVMSDQRRDDVIERIGAQVAEGRQVYWVCPLIEESEALDLSNATQTHADLSEALPGVLVGLLHSRMTSPEKKVVMDMFKAGHMGLLVSTTVIEVGVDVPNASLMVIEHAERFGLSQLHQLRGRVGRGAAASACVLIYSPPEGGRLSETARERLKAMAETNDGFEIARRDLEIRGPGEFMGARQSGAAMLRFADLETDGHLLAWAREAAAQMLVKNPEAAEKHSARWLGTKAEFLKA